MFIISIYLFLLPGIACAGEINCKDDTEQSVTKKSGHEEPEEDDCGNFCDCSCCVHIVTVNLQVPTITMLKPSAVIIKYYFYHNISLPSNYFGNIWQPPRLV